MIRHFFFLFILVSILISCSNKQPETPDYLIPETEMVAIMVDMHLVESAHNLKVLQPDSANANYDQLFSSIFTTHGVSKAKFDSSLFYYSTQTEQMNVIYDKLLERLYELESEVKTDH